MMKKSGYASLAYKPDLADAAKRWEAFYAGEIIDRPILCVTAPRDGRKVPPSPSYRARVHDDIDQVIDRAIAVAEATYWAGDAIPAFMPSFGPDEIAVFCGATLEWSNDSGDTNWSKPFVHDWKKDLPLRLHEDHPLWQRMLALYRRAAERMAGKMLLMPPDLHTNLDLLSAVRGPQRLCLDLVEQPAMIDRAMMDARAIFPQVWNAVRKAGRMDELGYCHQIYSMQGAAFLQCDFAALISPLMFKRWVLPALEEEAQLVKHCVYHWDGPSALVHADVLIKSRGLHTLSYVPGDGNGTHLDYIPLLKRLQEGGKAVHVWGTPEEMKLLHSELQPERVMYVTSTSSQDEADALVEWFVKHT
jgi:5-methyltetrahydrofolate--homocysteine methyltransferase